MFSTRKPQSKRRLSSLIAVAIFLSSNVLFPYTAQTSQLPEFPELRSCLPELTLQSEPTAQDTDIIPFNVSETKKTISKQHNHQTPGWLRSIVGTYGKIKEVYLPTADELAPSPKPLAPVVIHIQDIHQHYEAQKNIAYIIRNVAAYRYRHHLLNSNPRTSGDKPLTPAVIGLEGASGNFNFSPYRAYSDKELTKDIAEYFMKSGMIGGPEFYGITAHEDLTLPMTGVENTKLYSANVEAFKSSLGQTKEANETIVKARMILRHRKDRTLNPACLAFDKKREEYQEGKISLGQYIGFLGKLTQRALPVNSAMYVKAQSIEKSLDFAAVEKERSMIMELMSKNTPKTKTDDLLQLGLAYRKGSISFAEFYARFWKVAQNCGINMSEYPSLNKYVEYVTLVDKIVKIKLHAETRDMENSLENILAKTENEKALLESSHYLALVKKLVNRTLTSEEWQQYKSLSPLRSLRSLSLDENNLNKNSRPNGHNEHNGLNGLSLSSFEQFYEIAQQRNEALVSNLLKSLPQLSNDQATISMPPIAVLIAGGFHTKGISQLLKEKNIPFVAIMPDITKSGSGRTALEMLVREKTPLEKLFAGEKISLRNPVSVGLSNPNDTSDEAISLLFGAAEITGSLLGKRNDHAIRETDFRSFEVSKQPKFRSIDDTLEAIEFEVTIKTPQGNKRTATVIGIQTKISDTQEKLKNNDQYSALIGTAKQIASIELSDGTKLDIHVQVEDSLRDSFQTVVSQVKESFNKIFEPNIANQAQTVENTFQQGIKAVIDLALSEKTTEPQRGQSFFGKVEFEPILGALYTLGATNGTIVRNFVSALNNVLTKMGMEESAAEEITSKLVLAWLPMGEGQEKGEEGQEKGELDFKKFLLPFMGINEVAKAVSNIVFGERQEGKTSVVSLAEALENSKSVNHEIAKTANNVITKLNQELGLTGENMLKLSDIQVIYGELQQQGSQNIDFESFGAESFTKKSFMAITTDLNGRLKVMVHADTLQEYAENIDNFLATAINHEVLEFNGFSHDDVVRKAELSLEGTKDKSPIEITAMAKNFAERNGVKLTVQKSAEIRSAIKTELVSALKKSNVADQLNINNRVKINNKEISSIEELIPEIESNLTAAFELRDQIGEISDKYNNLLSAVSLLNWVELFSNNTRNDYQNMPLISKNMRSDDFMNMSAQQQAVVDLMDGYQKLYQSFSKIENMPNAVSTKAKIKEMLPVIQEHLAVFVNKFFETASILSNPKESNGKLGMDLTTMQRAVKELVGLFKADSNKPGAAKLTEALQRNVARTKYLVSQKPQEIQNLVETTENNIKGLTANVFDVSHLSDKIVGNLLQQLSKVNVDPDGNARIVVPLLVNKDVADIDTFRETIKKAIIAKAEKQGMKNAAETMEKVFNATHFAELVITRKDLAVKPSVGTEMQIDLEVIDSTIQEWTTAMAEKGLLPKIDEFVPVQMFTDKINLFKDSWFKNLSSEEVATRFTLYLILSDTQVMEVPRIEEIMQIASEADKQA